MQFPQSRYLASKKTVDDRALNQNVIATLKSQLTQGAVDVVELGAGLGTMVARALEWNLVRSGTWLLVDLDETSLRDSRDWLVNWATQRSVPCVASSDSLRIDDRLTVKTLCTDARALTLPSCDLLVANAFLDLVDAKSFLAALAPRLKPGALFWFTINFDGESIFVPEHEHDDAVLGVYHRSMDTRRQRGLEGHSRTGRRLFEAIDEAGLTLLQAGSSDWVVHAVKGRYPADEAEFVGHILRTIELELLSRPDEISAERVNAWVKTRTQQLAASQLRYLAHQLDFVGVK